MLHSTIGHYATNQTGSQNDGALVVWGDCAVDRLGSVVLAEAAGLSGAIVANGVAKTASDPRVIAAIDGAPQRAEQTTRGRPMDQSAPDQQLLTILTTEHFVLQTARGSTVGEANGRASIYLGAVSSGLIALGFVANDGRRLALFAAVVLPALLLLGWFTFGRLVQVSVENVLYLQRIQRIRATYAHTAPPGTPWFADLRSDADEAGGALRSTGIRPGPVQMLYTTASMIAAINCVVLGAAVCLTLRGLHVTLAAAVALAVVLAIAIFVAHTVYQRREFARGLA